MHQVILIKFYARFVRTFYYLNFNSVGEKRVSNFKFCALRPNDSDAHCSQITHNNTKRQGQEDKSQGVLEFLLQFNHSGETHFLRIAIFLRLKKSFFQNFLAKRTLKEKVK